MHLTAAFPSRLDTQAGQSHSCPWGIVYANMNVRLKLSGHGDLFLGQRLDEKRNHLVRRIIIVRFKVGAIEFILGLSAMVAVHVSVTVCDSYREHTYSSRVKSSSSISSLTNCMTKYGYLV